MSRIRAVCCDLDDTLFDHSGATRRALADILANDDAARDWPLAQVEVEHNQILEVLHAEVLRGARTIDEARVERFHRLLSAFGAATPERAARWAGAYRRAYEHAWQAVPGAVEFVAAARAAGMPVAIVTNNLRREQAMKIERVGLAPHVTTLVTSEEVGSPKPAPEMFEMAVARMSVAAADAVMLGDGWPTDIEGARAIGMPVVWFNPRRLPSPDASVLELDSLEPASRALSRILTV
jgi:HAD superfamily hydrolase (TIGR01509 family)